MLADIPALSIYAVYIAIDDDIVKDQLRAYITTLKRIKPTISGDDLRARGLPPGPQYRKILDSLKKAWLDGKVSSREARVRAPGKADKQHNSGGIVIYWLFPMRFPDYLLVRVF